MSKIKNWLFTALLIIGGIADLGFDILSKFAIELNIDQKYVLYCQVVIFFVAMIKLKLALPTQDPDKLQEIANKKYVEKTKKLEASGDGAVIPNKGF